jgi:hypothetical protein
MAENYVWRWNENNPEIIARLIPKSQIIKESGSDFTFFGNKVGFKQAIVGPGEIALFILNGKITETYTQDKMTGLSGGFFNRLGNMFGGGDDFQILFLSMEQIDYLFPVGAKEDDKCPLTRDSYPMRGSAVFEFQIDPANAVKIISLMRTSGVLLKNALVNRLYFETNVTVFENLVAKYEAKDFRGNMEIIRNVENVAQIELQRTFSVYGVKLTRLITKWERNDFDRALTEMQKLDTAFMVANKEHDDWMRRAGIKQEQIMKTIEYTFQSEAEQIKTEERKITLRLQEQAEQVKLKERTTDISFDAGLNRQDRAFEQGTRQVYKGADSEDYKRKKEIERDNMELQNLMAAKKQMKDIKVTEYQGTVLESQRVGADVEKTKAQMDAEKARFNLDTYRIALNDERSHQVNMMAQTANLMNSAKQNVPHTLVQGASNTAVGVSESTISAPPMARGGGTPCPSCGEPVAANKKFCPECGAKMVQPQGGSPCQSCGSQIPAGKKFCPDCGNKL